MRFRHFSFLRAAALIASLPFTACSNLGYYAQLAQGQYQLMSAREPIAGIIKDDHRDPALRERLRKVLDARAFAAQQLGLPDNASYTQYADLKRPYVIWNVFAAPELSLKPVEHCFLFVGCLAYRGYFDKQKAQQQADDLKAQGDDVFVVGIPAYSTLGWFDDPVINTMLNWSDEVLIATVFHELGHQKLYLKDDTTFNESFANFVGEEGLREYLAVRGGDSSTEILRRQREHRFIGLVLASRKRLQELYDSDAPDDAKRAGKEAEFSRLRAEYQTLRENEWKDFAGYDRWFAGELNNARLLPFGLYDEYVPAFAALFHQQHDNWQAFYAAAKALSELPDDERKERLKALKENDAG
jgi:predicted aminopeptidase